MPAGKRIGGGCRFQDPGSPRLGHAVFVDYRGDEYLLTIDGQRCADGRQVGMAMHIQHGVKISF